MSQGTTSNKNTEGYDDLRLFCLGFPKTGTCSIQGALEKVGLKVAHSNATHGRVAQLLYLAHYEGRNPMYHLPYQAIVHPSVCVPRKRLNYWPQMDLELLQSLRDHNPNAIFCLNTRKPKHLRDSIERWRDQGERYLNTEIPGLPAGTGTGKEIAIWITWHWDRMRKFFNGDPNFIEIDIENGDQCKYRLTQALGLWIDEWPWLNRNQA